MNKKDREKLKKLMMDYSSKEIMAELSEVALEVAGDLSDIGNKDQAKNYVQMSVSIDDLISGRPFLI